MKLVDATLQLSGRLGDSLRRPEPNLLDSAGQTSRFFGHNSETESLASSAVLEKETPHAADQAVVDGTRDVSMSGVLAGIHLSNALVARTLLCSQCNS